MDRVQLLKQESGELGGDPFDTVPYPDPIEPQEDAIEVAGVYIQDPSNRDESTLISRSGNDMQFQDGSNPAPVTLTQLLAAAGVFDPDTIMVDDVTLSVLSDDVMANVLVDA